MCSTKTKQSCPPNKKSSRALSIDRIIPGVRSLVMFVAHLNESSRQTKSETVIRSSTNGCWISFIRWFPFNGGGARDCKCAAHVHQSRNCSFTFICTQLCAAANNLFKTENPISSWLPNSREEKMMEDEKQREMQCSKFLPAKMSRENYFRSLAVWKWFNERMLAQDRCSDKKEKLAQHLANQYYYSSSRQEFVCHLWVSRERRVRRKSQEVGRRRPCIPTNRIGRSNAIGLHSKAEKGTCTLTP